jgi:hypothetical protein
MAKKPEFYTIEELGPQRKLTPEGFLLCCDTPIARIGKMEYGPGETPLPPGRDGRVHVNRTEKEVFSPQSIASIAGKPITDDHPPVDVAPDNWSFYAKGVVMHPRRGERELKDFLVADLMIWDAALIADIDSGKREVSCGYNPDYLAEVDDAGDEIPGRGEQTNILYNHLALVDRGRCGARCSIGDHQTLEDIEVPASDSLQSMQEEIKPMSWKDSLLAAFTAKDEKAMKAALDAAPESPVTIINHSTGGPSRRTRDEGEEMGEKEPDTVEIHNHIPGEDAARGEMVERPEQGFRAGDDETPPWLEKFQKDCDARFKAMDDKMNEGFKKWAKEEGEEPEHSEDGEGEPEAEMMEMDHSRDRRDSKDEENKKILGELEFEAPPGTNDKARKAKDSTYLADAFQDAASKAEIIAPGIRLPAFDRSAPPAKSFRALNALRRTALDLAYTKAETRGFIDAALSGRTMDTKVMPFAHTRMLFNSVAASLASDNNRRSTDGTFQPVNGGGMQIKGPAKSLADINRRNQERFSPRKSA